MRRNRFLSVTSVLWLVGIAISHISQSVSDALFGLGLAALVIGLAQIILEERGIQLSSLNGAKYCYALFVIGSAAIIGGALGPPLGVAQPTADVVESIGGTLIGLSLLAFLLAYLDSTS